MTNFLKKLSCIFCGFFIFINTLYAETAQATATNADIRLYTLNCGYIVIPDMSSFSAAGKYSHAPGLLADPCFLIKDPKGWLIWDLGLGDQYLHHPSENTKLGVTLVVPVSLTAQLKQLGLTPKDIKYVAISHSHFDHTGNANLFPQATWLMQSEENQFVHQKPLPIPVGPSFVSFLKGKNVTWLNGDYDVFADGKVKILKTPGHTPGHQSLEIALPHQGVIILSGDLYHLRQSYLSKQIPAFNSSQQQTLASMTRIENILHDTQGRLIIQHDPTDFSLLPQSPSYLD